MLPVGQVRLSTRCLTLFPRDETGAGTVFALFAIVICLMLAGLSIDIGNNWRNRELLRLSADVSAHAGASVLAQGGDPATAIITALNSVELNTPESSYGRLIDDPYTAVQTWHYDPASGFLSMSGEINAVSVELQRSAKVRNPLPTYLLKLAGLSSFNISTRSVVAAVPTEVCSPGSGIYAHAGIDLEGEAAVGGGFCLHSQTVINLSGQTLFMSGAGLSLPDLSDCRGSCSNLSSPGFEDSAMSMNLVMEGAAARIDRLKMAFLRQDKAVPEVADFFSNRPLEGDMSMLAEIGVDVAKLVRGSVVPLTSEQFGRMRGLPAGLVYNVTCPSVEGESPTLGIGKTLADMGLAEAGVDAGSVRSTTGEDDGTAPDGDWSGEDGAVWGDENSPASEAATDDIPVMRNMALITNCPVHFNELARIEGSLILSTSRGSAIAVTASEGASVGDRAGACRTSARSVIMAKGDMRVPASFTASNATFLIAGSVMILGDAAGEMALHRGLGLHAGGPVTFSGKHAFESCGSADIDSLLPALKVIRYVTPIDPVR